MNTPPVPDREPWNGWSGRGMRAGNTGKYSAAALAEQKRVRELLSQSRELVKD